MSGCLTWLAMLALGADAAGASSTVRPIPREWDAGALRRLPVATVAASSEFAAAEGGYSPSRACDGNRQTKWVACVEPSEAAPQWITLELAGGAQEVTAIAVFGEAVNNDGVIDALVQLAEAVVPQVADAGTPRGFRTVCAVKDAASGSWLVTLPPVKTSAVRLLITRSGGPSPNTDVYEVEVYGPPLSPAEVKRQRDERIAKVWPSREAALEQAREVARKAGAGNAVLDLRDGGFVRILNRDVAVTLDESDGAWDAAWTGATAAALHRVRLSVEIDGKALPLRRAVAHAAPFADKVGPGRQIRQAWDGAVRVERILRVYDGRPTVTVSGRITNAGNGDISLGTVCLVDLSESDRGWWFVGHVAEAPAAVWIQGISELLCTPWAREDAPAVDRGWSSTGILTLAHRSPSAGLAFGYLTAKEARPDLVARVRAYEGGSVLLARQRFLGRRLGDGESIELDPVYLSVHGDAYAALERYGDAAAAFAPEPVRTKPMSLWCSWYAHRMAMSEDLVLANAEIAARHFKPLGMEIIQLDHGWQRGDVTGDWVVNERFPHGLPWLAKELQSRYGMRLGVWIAPTDVAETSRLFETQADWMLKDGAGRPLVNWKWYWKPNPNCYELDVTKPAAARHLENTFARLTAEGVSYYKIDFIAASGGEHFRQSDPKATPGWSNLRRAMETIRRGAGASAQIRYCQTPPLLSAGLADGAYGGVDTLDAGVPGRFDVLRTNVRSLAAGYWIHDRLYHREVCDMSVRMQADVEEVRVRLAMMTLAGCSISFSDEFQYLPPSRIRMMQQCLPPGCPPMRPVDLWSRANPSVWHIHCRTAADEWDIVGLFNLEEQPEERAVDFASLGLPSDADMLVFEFWREEFLGVRRGGVALTLPPHTSRILSIRRPLDRPQVIGTDMHVLQGYHEIERMKWDGTAKTLSGEYRRAAGMAGRAFVYVPEGWQPHFDFPLAPTSAKLTNIGGRLWAQEVTLPDGRCTWSIPFDEAR